MEIKTATIAGRVLLCWLWQCAFLPPFYFSEFLFPAGVMQLLRPLLLDIVPTIQQTAALALGRLANYNDDLAEAVVKGDILPQLVYSLAEQNVCASSSLCLVPYLC